MLWECCARTEDRAVAGGEHPPWSGGLSVLCCWPCTAARGWQGSSATAGLAAPSAGTAASSAPSATMDPRPRCAAGPAACATAAPPERRVWTRPGAPVTTRSPAPGLRCQVSCWASGRCASFFGSSIAPFPRWHQPDPSSLSMPFRAPSCDHCSRKGWSLGTVLILVLCGPESLILFIRRGNNLGLHSKYLSIHLS